MPTAVVDGGVVCDCEEVVGVLALGFGLVGGVIGGISVWPLGYCYRS